MAREFDNNGVKTPDREIEHLVRDFLNAYYSMSANPLEKAEAIARAVNPLRWHIDKKDACEFVENWGAECREKATRVSHGIACCEEHATKRDRSFGIYAATGGKAGA